MLQKVIKTIAVFLVAIIVYSVSGNVISYAIDRLLTENELESQGTATNNKNVEVDVYYAGGKHSQVADVSDTEQKINVKVDVKNAGYLENITVDFSAANFKIASDGEQAAIQTIDENNNKLILNRINGGESVTVSLKITPNIKDQVVSNFFNRDNAIRFTGTYVNEKEKEININKEIVLHEEWISEAEAEIAQSVTKYIPYSVDNKSGVLLQTTVATNIKNSILPIKTSHIEIEIPKIENELPDRVIVVAEKTEATNGNRNGIEFTSNNWNYDAEKGMVTIDVSNLDGDTISWLKNTQDEYNVICVYSEEVANKVLKAGTTINLKSRVKNSLYNNTEKEVEKEIEGTASLKEQIGEMVDVKSSIVEDNINKGYMYTNKVATENNRNETIYNEKYEVYIADTELTDEIEIEQANDIFTQGAAERTATLLADNYTHNRSLTISKAQVDKILGEAGQITILAGEEAIASITKGTETNESGNIEIDLSNYSNKYIKIKISKAEAEGRIEIDVKKVIGKNFQFSLDDIKTFETIKTSTNAIAKANGNNINVSIENDVAVLTEPTSKASITINKENLSTVVENDNVEIRAVLETNSIDDVLYKNPTIDIQLPSYITDVNITNSQVLYTDELTMTSTTLIEGTTGKIIRVTLNGTQTRYNDTTTNGINIVINANLMVNKLTPSKTDTIQMVFTNENETEARAVTTQVIFVAPTGVVTVNEISAYSANAQTISLVSESNENNTAQLDIYSSAKVATVKGQIINNYENNITDVVVLGSIPNVDKEGNTFNVSLTGAIKVSGVDVTVYYSTNANATKDLNNSNNGWTTQVQDYSLVKSYLIVVNTQMEKGTEIAIEYAISIPENLAYNNTDKLIYTVYYNNNSEVGTIAETANAKEITMTTGIGPNLEVTLETDPEIGNTVRQGQYVNFTATIKNTGAVATNVVLEIDEIYGKVQKFDYIAADFVNGTNIIKIGDIQKDESKEIKYLLKIKEEIEPKENSEFIVHTTSENLNAQINTVEKLNIDNSYVQIIDMSNNRNGFEILAGTNKRFGYAIINTTEDTLSNIEFKCKLSNGIKILTAGTVEEFFDENIDNENVKIEENEVTYKINKLEEGDSITFVIDTMIDYDITGYISIIAKASGNYNWKSWEMYSYRNIFEIQESKITIDAKEISKQDVFEGEDISYEFSIKNEEDFIALVYEIYSQIPEGTTFKSAEITKKDNNGETIETEIIDSIQDNRFEYSSILKYDSKQLDVKITVTTNILTEEEIENGILEKELSMDLGFLSGDRIEKKSDYITYYLIYDETTHNRLTGKEEPSNPTDPEKSIYKINGRVWLDDNKNDQRDNGEIGMPGIEVILINAETMEIAEDKDSKEEKIVKTAEDGTYEFTNLEAGKYMVAFLYDNNEYSIAQYQKDGVASSINSDAISKTITYKGETRIAGLTDILTIIDGSIRNIDLGLAIADKFNLNLEKKIRKITINNAAGTEEYDYSSDPKQLSKVEIKDKYLSGSTVIVEYVIKVTNTGTVPGYVKKIVDYIPADMKFNSELNTQWYLGTDGNVYDMELAEMPINPGESKEVVIILTKKMTDSNTGITNNDAELYEVYNEKGLVDIDSTPANKNTSENDMSTATLIVSVKTGQVVIYTTLTIVVISILGFGVYEIKKHVLDKKI